VRLPNAIGLDMGGTSPTSRSSTRRGAVTKEWFVEYGYPICFPSIEVLHDRRRRRLAGLDRRGRLAAQRPAVGGRRPRPGRYGAAATTPTNTDANVVLGRLGDELLGGAMTLDRAARARAARAASPTRSGSAPRPREASCRSRTRTWPTRCG
jgi:N-methylhydantoinase A